MLTIGKLAKATEASIDTLRYYERLGLLKPDTRTVNDYRMYEKPAINRVRFIKNAKHLGFTLSEIEKLLEFGTSKSGSSGDVLKLTEEKLIEHKNKIKELQKIQAVLMDLAKKCSGKGPASECPILKSLYPGT
jgi:DNA-binding transcriptional MerR regulator